MIILIDDTNLESLNASYVFSRDYENVIHLVRDANSLDDICNTDALINADCIMVHRTFADSTIIKEKMAEFTNDGDNIPLVIFSAGDSEHAEYNEDKPTVIDGMKKSVFYNRLPYLLNVYKEKQIIDLRLLAYGEDYAKVRIRTLALAVLRKTLHKEGLITVQELANIAASPSFKDFVFLSNPALGFSYNELLEELEDNPITFKEFRDKVNQIVNSFNLYGKNIYIWR